MKLELSNEDARFLKDQLTRHAARVEDELVHTDKHELQHALARDAQRLRQILGRLEGALEAQSSSTGVP